MKKNKIVLFLALAMLGASVVPVYYWHKHSNDRFPSSVDSADIEVEMQEGKYATPINYLENQDMFERDPATDEEKEIQAHMDFLKNHQEEIAKKDEEEEIEAHLDFLKNHQEKIKEEVTVTCTAEQDNLTDKVEKLLADKEELLKEIALLKEKKESSKSEKSEDKEKVVAKKESEVETTTALMMAQLSQAMTSQQMLMQSQMQLMMMMQQQQQDQSKESMYSKFAFDYYAFDARERMFQRMSQYNPYSYGGFGNIGGGIGLGYGADSSSQSQGVFSVSGQDVKPIPVNPMANYPYVVQPTALYNPNYPVYSANPYGTMAQHPGNQSFDFSVPTIEQFEF